MITPKVIYGPVVEPVTIEELKDQIGYTESDKDVKLAMYIEAARSAIEADTSRTIHEQTLEIALAYWPCDGGPIFLPRATPLIEVLSVTYKDAAGTVTPWTGYEVDYDSCPGAILPPYTQTYPSFTPYSSGAVRIRYRAGIPSSPVTEAEAAVKIPVLMLAAAYCENPEAVVVENGALSQIVPAYGIPAMLARLKGEVREPRPALVEVMLP